MIMVESLLWIKWEKVMFPQEEREGATEVCVQLDKKCTHTRDTKSEVMTMIMARI